MVWIANVEKGKWQQSDVYSKNQFVIALSVNGWTSVQVIFKENFNRYFLFFSLTETNSLPSFYLILQCNKIIISD